jgi:CRP/FNR family cyclic AMP-dependent transcriptional regulator
VAISKHAVRQALKNEPSFAQRFVTHLIHRTSRVEEDLIDQLFKSSERRIARLLLLLAHFGREGVPQPIDIEIGQETLAEMIGTTRSRVSLFMNKFRKLGFISYNGKIHIHNSLLTRISHVAERSGEAPCYFPRPQAVGRAQRWRQVGCGQTLIFGLVSVGR